MQLERREEMKSTKERENQGKRNLRKRREYDRTTMKRK